MATDREILKNAAYGRVGSSGFAADPSVVVRAKHTRHYQFLVSDFGVAGRAITKTAIHMPVKGRVTAVSITSPLAVTGDDTSYATVTVAKQTGTTAATIAAIATKATIAAGAIGTAANLAAAVPYKVLANAFTVANMQMAADDVLTVAISKTSSGVALTTAASVVEGTNGSGTDSFSTDYFTICVSVEEN